MQIEVIATKLKKHVAAYIVVLFLSLLFPRRLVVSKQTLTYFLAHTKLRRTAYSPLRKHN
jgi:hypothetical protein